MRDDGLIALKAQHALRLERPDFDKQVDRFWAKASKATLSAKNREVMYQAHLALGLSPLALCAGFADAIKSGYLR